MTFGEKLKKARTNAGLKQSELAKKLGTTGNTISNWENNVSKPDLDMLAYICGALEVKASYFLQAHLPQDEVTAEELKKIRKYRDLDIHGKEMVDFVLEREHERVTSFQSTITQFPNAAHALPNATTEDIKHDEDIMDDDDF